MNNLSVCYLCSILDERTKAQRAIVFDSPAATKKVFDVCHALQLKSKQVYVVTMARGKQKGVPKHFPASAKQTAKIPVLYAGFSPTFLWTYWVSMFSIFALVWRVHHQTQGTTLHLIAYNRNWLYVPSLILTRVRRGKCYLDLEDGALVDTSGLLARVRYSLIKFAFDLLCSHGSILVTPGLISQVSTTNNAVCYGVAQTPTDVLFNDWDIDKVRFLLGGTLMRETGASLLIEAVRILNRDFLRYKGQLTIYITGHGELAEELANFAQAEGRGWIEYKGRVAKAEYDKLLNTSHVGLCLKLPSCEMGSTTFPSKVIEIAALGKLVLTTNLGHVGELFGADGAIYLIDENPQTLANAIISIVTHRETSMQSAHLGQQRVFEICSAEKVADDFSRLFAGNTSS